LPYGFFWKPEGKLVVAGAAVVEVTVAVSGAEVVEAVEVAAASYSSYGSSQRIVEVDAVVVTGIGAMVVKVAVTEAAEAAQLKCREGDCYRSGACSTQFCPEPCPTYLLVTQTQCGCLAPPWSSGG
jgi:hypothetical protein